MDPLPTPLPHFYSNSDSDSDVPPPPPLYHKTSSTSGVPMDETIPSASLNCVDPISKNLAKPTTEFFLLYRSDLDLLSSCVFTSPLVLPDTHGRFLVTVGGNDKGQLGRDAGCSEYSPRVVLGVYGGIGECHRNPCTVFSGGYSSAMIDINSKAWLWGEGAQAIPGDTIQSLPVCIKSSRLNGLKVRMVALGIEHTLILASDGSAWAWGRSKYTGLGTTSTSWIVNPQCIESLSNTRYIACSSTFSIASTSYPSRVYSWGDSGPWLGARGTISPRVPAPIVEFSPAISQVSCGPFHSIFLDEDGSVYSCGRNTSGCLGTGNYTDVVQPVRIDMPCKASFVSCGSQHSCAVSTIGTIYSWGGNSSRQLGLSTLDGVDSCCEPRIVGAGQEIHFRKLSCLPFATVAITNSGEVWFWGSLKSIKKTMCPPRPMKRFIGTRVYDLSVGEDFVTVLCSKKRSSSVLVATMDEMVDLDIAVLASNQPETIGSLKYASSSSMSLSESRDLICESLQTSASFCFLTPRDSNMRYITLVPIDPIRESVTLLDDVVQNSTLFISFTGVNESSSLSLRSKSYKVRIKFEGDPRPCGKIKFPSHLISDITLKDVRRKITTDLEIQSFNFIYNSSPVSLEAEDKVFTR